jgi:hypothetical protein
VEKIDSKEEMRKMGIEFKEKEMTKEFCCKEN